MKKVAVFFIILLMSSCNRHSGNIDDAHIKKLAENFMQQKVIPAMSNPKPFEIAGMKVIVKTAASNVDDYRFMYDHLPQDRMDSLVNKAKLDSVVAACKSPDSVISITVNVAYKTKYQRGDVVTDSIKLGYNAIKDEVGYWPF